MAIGTAEIPILILAILVAPVLYKVFKKITSLVINAALGVSALIIAKYLLGLKIAINWIVVLICAFGGIFGILIVMMLNYLNLAFI